MATITDESHDHAPSTAPPPTTEPQRLAAARQLLKTHDGRPEFEETKQVIDARERPLDRCRRQPTLRG
jgi:hypothetical protein